MLSLPSGPFLGGVSKLLEKSPSQDWADRLLNPFTSCVLLFCALLIGVEQHFGKPIACMTPAESVGTWDNFYHQYCYIGVKDSSIFTVSHAESHSFDATEIENTVSYYQWVPYCLVVQLLITLIPFAFWRISNSSFGNGNEMESILFECDKLGSLFGDERMQCLQSIICFIHSFLDRTRKPSEHGSRSFTIYVIYKWIQFFSILGQLFLLALFVGKGSHIWGFSALLSVLAGKSNEPRGLFPRLILCRVPVLRNIRQNTHLETMQCVMTLNFVLEKMYIILYFWFFLLLLIVGLFALHYTAVYVSSRYRVYTAITFMSCNNVGGTVDVRLSAGPSSGQLRQYFIVDVLQKDGWLLLKFLHSQAGSMVGYDVISALWKETVQRAPDRNLMDLLLSGDRLMSYIPIDTDNLYPGEKLNARRGPSAPAWVDSERPTKSSAAVSGRSRLEAGQDSLLPSGAPPSIVRRSMVEPLASRRASLSRQSRSDSSLPPSRLYSSDC